jgi:hypothetical protein
MFQTRTNPEARAFYSSQGKHFRSDRAWNPVRMQSEDLFYLNHRAKAVPQRFSLTVLSHPAEMPINNLDATLPCYAEP